MKFRLAAVSVVFMALISSGAYATTVYFDIEGTDQIGFDLIVGESPTNSVAGEYSAFADTNVSLGRIEGVNETANSTGVTLINASNTSFDGFAGGVAIDGVVLLSGPQLYTGTEASPTFFLTPTQEPIELINKTYGGTDYLTITADGPLTPPPPITSAAPEPGTWALMLGGLGMVGGMLRIDKARRREEDVAGIATA